MPRKMRFYLPGMPAHVMQRGHNREPVFFSDPPNSATNFCFLSSVQCGIDLFFVNRCVLYFFTNCVQTSGTLFGFALLNLKLFPFRITFLHKFR